MAFTSTALMKHALRLCLILCLNINLTVVYGQPVNEGTCAQCKAAGIANATTYYCYCCDSEDCSGCVENGTGECGFDQVFYCRAGEGQESGAYDDCVADLGIPFGLIWPLGMAGFLVLGLKELFY